MTAPDAERRSALPYYRWYWQAWRANRAVQRMTPLARGLYRELLDEQWAEGFVPDDPEKCAEICNCRLVDFRREWPAIRERFAVRGPGILINERLELERTSVDEVRVKNSQAGRRGGLAKAGHGPDLQRPLALASGGQIEEERKEEERKGETVADAARAAADRVVAEWNRFALSKGWAQCTVINPSRRRQLTARVREKGWLERLPAAFTHLTRSRWHAENPITIDTFLRPGKVDAYAEQATVEEGRGVKSGPRADVDRAALANLDRAGGSDAAKSGGARGAEDLL